MSLNSQVDLETELLQGKSESTKTAPTPPPRRRLTQTMEKSDSTNQMNTEFLNNATKCSTIQNNTDSEISFLKQTQWNNIPPPLNLYTPQQTIIHHNGNSCQMAVTTSTAMHFLTDIPNQNVILY